ncbi:MAG: phosphoribosyltransferase [Armatimonadota bacterium]
MNSEAEATVHDLPHLRNRVHVFADRAEAGMVLAGMLGEYRDTDAIVLAIPAGGVPVGAALAQELSLPLDVAVVSKITLPWNTEAGYGAVAFDGTVRLNDALVARTRLTEEEIERGTAETTEKVARRIEALRGDRPLPALAQRPVLLVDDGLASGFTMRVAVEALRKADAGRIVVAVPTGHDHSVQALKQEVDAIYCPNIRGGWRYAVAEAYELWYDVPLDEVKQLLDPD